MPINLWLCEEQNCLWRSKMKSHLQPETLWWWCRIAHRITFLISHYSPRLAIKVTNKFRSGFTSPLSLALQSINIFGISRNNWAACWKMGVKGDLGRKYIIWYSYRTVGQRIAKMVIEWRWIESMVGEI